MVRNDDWEFLISGTNVDSDVHTETHFNILNESEFDLEEINIYRSRSLPNILMESEEENSVCSMTKQCNHAGSKIFITHVSDSPKGNDYYRYTVTHCKLYYFGTYYTMKNLKNYR